MRILIIEDEQLTAERLSRMLTGLLSQVSVDTVQGSIEAIAYLSQYAEPDLIFIDNELADGRSLEIFRTVHIRSHVIFITAYDDLAIRTFKTNGLDYLLKPINRQELKMLFANYTDRYKNRHPHHNMVKFLQSLDQLAPIRFLG